MMVPVMKKLNLQNLFFLLRDVLHYFFNWCFGGGKCLVCGRNSFAGEICKDCRENVFFRGISRYSIVNRCSVCGKFLLSEDKVCTDCRKERVIKSCDRVVPILPYRLWAKNVMFQWKVLEKRALSPVLAKMVHKAIGFYYGNNHKIIVPVPPRPGKIRKKGWDQIDELCSYLKFRYGYEVLHLLKRKDRIQQKKLGRSQRLESCDERYCFSGSVRKDEKLPECVILIDDVMTTGSTLESCSKLLKEAGITKVYAMSIFIVD